MNKTISFQSKSIHYQIIGEGITIVLLHGFMEDISMWKDHIKILAKQYQVLAIDLPGHGQSEVIAEVHSMELMADLTIHILQLENIEKCVLIGHSMGGYASLAFAEKYPDKLLGFGLFHSHTMGDTEEAKRNRERTIEVVKNEKGGFINQFIPSLFAEENRVKFQNEINHQIKLADEMNPMGITAALAGMKDRPMRLNIVAFSPVPVLFILGKFDSRIPLEMVLAQAVAPNCSQINILGNSGHMGWLEEKEISIAAIEGFVIMCLAKAKL